MKFGLLSSCHVASNARAILSAAGVCAVLAVGAGCDRQTAGSAAPPVAARVGDGVILVADVQSEIERRVERGNLVPAKERLLDDMIERRLLLDKARQAGLDKEPELVRSWENLVISRYKDQYLRKEERQATVTPEEIEQRYKGSPERFRRAAKARLAVLMTPLPPTLSPEERTSKLDAMKDAKTQALQSADTPGFGPLALKFSEDEVTRHRGGDAGWLDEGVAYRWPDPVVRAGFALAPGSISDPIEVDGAVYLVKKSDERPPAMVPLENVREQLRREIHTEKLRAIEGTFATQLRNGIAIETFPESLQDVRVPVPDDKTVAAEAVPPAIP